MGAFLDITRAADSSLRRSAVLSRMARPQMTDFQMSSPYTHDHQIASVSRPVKERVLGRFEKGDHVAEIREREITQFAGFEWIVYVDGSMTESRMYYGDRLKAYGLELLARKGCFLEDGWIEAPNDEHHLSL